MSLSLAAPQRTVLLVSDETLDVYVVGAKNTEFIQSIPWEIDNFVPEVSDIIARRCKGKPVLILNDMVEQHYRKEKIIKAGVGLMDKSGMVKRKLNLAFPNYPVRAALPLKEKLGATERIPADLYIFAAIPDSEQYIKTISATQKSFASLAGLCLLPMESSDMVKALSMKLAKDKGLQTGWSIFIGQHKNGGLRQIVTKNGEIALTRMTSITTSHEDSQQWAKEVHQEFAATMSYLSRFGYSSGAPLDVIIVGQDGPVGALKSMIDEDIDIHTMSPAKAAQLLKLPISGQNLQHYADPLHVAWSGRKPKFILSMQANALDQVSKPRQMALLGSVVLLCGAVFLGYQMFSAFDALSNNKSDLELTKSRLVQLNATYDAELEKKESLGFDVHLVQSTVKIHTQLEEESLQVIDFVRGVGDALGQDLRVDKTIIARNGEKAAGLSFLSRGRDEKAKPLFETKLKISYPGTADVERGNQEVKNLAARLGEVLSGYEVEVTKLLKDYEYTEGLIIEAGDLNKENLTQDFIAEISINGPMKGGEDND